MTPILTALGSGISAKKILDFLMRKSPDMGEKITKALASGLSAEKVLGFFSKDQNFDRLKQSIESQYSTENNANPLVQAQNVRSQNLGNDMASGLQRKAPAILGGAAALGTGLAMQHAIPRMLQGGLGAVSQQTTPTETQTQTPINPQTSQPPVNEPNLLQQQSLPQPELKPIDSTEALKSANFTSKIDSMIKSGNDVESITDFYRKLNPEAVNQIEKQAAKPFEQVISEYMQSKNSLEEDDKLGFKTAFKTMEGGAATEKLYQGIFDALKNGKDTFAGIKDPLIKKAKPYFDKGLIKSPEDLKKFVNGTLEDIEPPETGGQEPPKPKYPPPPKGGGLLSRKAISETFENAAKPTSLKPESTESVEKSSKGSIVETPHGVGEVKEIRNGKALVEVDGKMLKMLEEELMGPSKEIRDIDFDQLARDYVESIPESDRSTAMLMNFFQPTSEDGETGQFFVMFPSDPEHVGVYKNVSKELADKINSAENIAKTSGKTILGEHEAGRADSRYAAASDLRKRPDLYPYEKLPVPYHLAKKLFTTLNELNNQDKAEESRKRKESKAAAKKEKNEPKKRKKQTA